MRWRFESVVEHQHCDSPGLRSPTGRGRSLKRCKVQVRSLPQAPRNIPANARLAQRESACLTHRMSAVRSGQRVPISSRSSVAEQSLDKRSTDVRFITGGPNRRGGHHDPKGFESSRFFFSRTCAPSGQGSGFLIRRESIVGSSPTRSSTSNSRSWRNRSTRRLERAVGDHAGSIPAERTNGPCPHLAKGPDCRSGKASSILVMGANLKT